MDPQTSAPITNTNTTVREAPPVSLDVSDVENNRKRKNVESTTTTTGVRASIKRPRLHGVNFNPRASTEKNAQIASFWNSNVLSKEKNTGLLSILSEINGNQKNPKQPSTFKKFEVPETFVPPNNSNNSNNTMSMIHNVIPTQSTHFEKVSSPTKPISVPMVPTAITITTTTSVPVPKTSTKPSTSHNAIIGLNEDLFETMRNEFYNSLKHPRTSGNNDIHIIPIDHSNASIALSQMISHCMDIESKNIISSKHLEELKKEYAGHNKFALLHQVFFCISKFMDGFLSKMDDTFIVDSNSKVELHKKQRTSLVEWASEHYRLTTKVYSVATSLCVTEANVVQTMKDGSLINDVDSNRIAELLCGKSLDIFRCINNIKIDISKCMIASSIWKLAVEESIITNSPNQSVFNAIKRKGDDSFSYAVNDGNKACFALRGIRKLYKWSHEFLSGMRVPEIGIPSLVVVQPMAKSFLRANTNITCPPPEMVNFPLSQSMQQQQQPQIQDRLPNFNSNSNSNSNNNANTMPSNFDSSPNRMTGLGNLSFDTLFNGDFGTDGTLDFLLDTAALCGNKTTP